MECNKDEALRAKETAEKRLLERDIAGAKKFALKAQNLFPQLEGLSQFLEIIDVYVADEKKIYGESDYYGILGVGPSVDEEVLKKQYKRMALFLHPDKNKSVGADGAFKILSQAWSVLSNKERRSAYNLKLNIRAANQTSFSSLIAQFTKTATDSWNIPYQLQTPPIATSQQCTTSSTSYQQTPRPPFHHQYASARIQPTWGPRPSWLETFWTSCNRCRVQFEYDKMYLNQNLLCCICKLPFLAIEVSAPSVNSCSSCPWSFPHQQQNMPTFSTGLSSEIGKRTSRAASYVPSSSSVPEKVEEASASAPSASSNGLNREKPAKKRRMNGQKDDIGTKTRTMLMEMARMEIIRQLNELETRSPHMERVETKGSASDSVNCVRTDKKRDDLLTDPKNTLPPQKSSTLDEPNDTEAYADESVSMIVPDANFHNFDEDRVEESFIENQVWAAYDDDDGMPRYYALVHDIISRKPFKIQISWLNSKSSSEFGPLDWIGSGFTKTTGDFRVGKFVLNRKLNSFSHPVKCKRGARGAIQIFPAKGDVWALYRNWSPDWDEFTADETIHKYDLAVVLEDYHEDTGVFVAPLVKVAGFMAVFDQVLDQRDIWKIPREEMFRFSHQVPFYMLDGTEAENAPKGCYELDPAALPLELLSVITHAESSEERALEQPVILRGTDGACEGMVQSTSEGKIGATQKGGVENTKNLLTYSRRKKRRMTEGDVDQSQKIKELQHFS